MATACSTSARIFAAATFRGCGLCSRHLGILPAQQGIPVGRCVDDVVFSCGADVVDAAAEGW